LVDVGYRIIRYNATLREAIKVGGEENRRNAVALTRKMKDAIR